MTITVSPVFLYDERTSSPQAAELWDGITEQQLADWETEWMPALSQGLKELRARGVPYVQWPQSRHWDWRRKVDALQKLLAHQGFCIVAQGVTQGMMIVGTAPYRCRIEEQKNKDLVYIEFVENAPWNRSELATPPQYRGIGSILIRAAVEFSLDQEFKGRIGLHALPQAHGFYANTCGMTDLGADRDHYGLRYFEMTPEQAQAFIAKGY